MSDPELVQRVEATYRLRELALGATEIGNPVVLLSRALEDCRIFLPAEVRSSVDIILDATCMEVQG